MPPFFFSVPGALATLGIVGLLANAAAGRRTSGLDRPGGSPSAATRLMQIGLSLVVVGAALYVILFKPDAPEDHKWAYSAVALVLGYWLRGAVN